MVLQVYCGRVGHRHLKVFYESKTLSFFEHYISVYLELERPPVTLYHLYYIIVMLIKGSEYD